MSQAPYASIFENKIAAESAAHVRNALVVTLSGKEMEIEDLRDWFRRTDAGVPMPAEWRELAGQIHVPWNVKPRPKPS